MVLNVKTSDGKYTVIQEDDGRLHVLRHGEEWRDCSGDKLIYILAADLESARQAYAQLNNAHLEGLVDVQAIVDSKVQDLESVRDAGKLVPLEGIYEVLHAAEAAGIELPSDVEKWWENETNNNQQCL